MELVVGIDSSTQSTKVEARDVETGDVVASGRASHPATTPPVSEQDPTAWWSALVDAVSQLGDARNDVVGISVAGQQHGLVLLDEHDVALRPAKLWNDTTSAPQAERLVEEFGPQWWAATTGVVPLAAVTISKLAWVAENEPELIEATRRVMLPHDYLTYRLTGAHVTDRGDASGTGWYDAVNDQLILDPLRSATGTADWADRLPTVLGAMTPAGELNQTSANELGLRAGISVGPGSGDNMGAALGLGLREGDAMISLGTSGTAYGRAAVRAKDPSGAVAGFCDATGQYLPLVCTLNATKVTDTIARLVGTDAPGLAELSDSLGPEAVGPVVVPYFDGERTPNRPEARGLIAGLTTEVMPAELARAAHDGVICGVLDGLDAVGAAGVTLDGRLVLVGGGAQSSAYRQRLADVSGRTVFVPTNDEAVVAGAAVQAAGIHLDVPFEVVADMWDLHSGDLVTPLASPAQSQVVRQRYRDASGFDDGLCRPLD